MQRKFFKVVNSTLFLDFSDKPPKTKGKRAKNFTFCVHKCNCVYFCNNFFQMGIDKAFAALYTNFEHTISSFCNLAVFLSSMRFKNCLQQPKLQCLFQNVGVKMHPTTLYCAQFEITLVKVTLRRKINTLIRQTKKRMSGNKGENMLTLAIFLVVVCAACFIAVLAILCDRVKNHGKKEDACATCEAPVEEQPAPAEEAPVATVADDDDRTSYVPVEGDDAIVFSAASKNETIDDRYAELSDEAKSYFDEIVKYALSKSDEVKRVKNARYEEYKIRQARLVRLLIKRGVVVCEFVLINDAFRSYLSENKVSVKLAPTVLRVVDEESLQVAKNSIDIAAQTAKEDQERKAQLRREKRKLAREAKKAEEAAAAAAAQAQEEAPAESTEE